MKSDDAEWCGLWTLGIGQSNSSLLLPTPYPIYCPVCQTNSISRILFSHIQDRGEGRGGLVKFIRGAFFKYFLYMTLAPFSDLISLSLSLADSLCAVHVSLCV